MKRLALSLALLCASVAVHAQDAANPADTALRALYQEYWAWQVREYGMIEKADGSVEEGAIIASATPAAQRARAAKAAEVRARLDKLDQAKLSPAERVNAAVLRAALSETIEDARFAEWEMPFDSNSNFWSYLDAPAGFQTVIEYDNYIARMNALPRYFAEQIANARAGLKRGFSVPAVTLAGRDASLAANVVDAPEKSPFWKAFAQIPARFSPEDRARLQAEGRAAIAGQVIPAYADALAFVRDEYLPNARKTLAAEAMPDGKAYYAQQLRQYSTLDLSPQEIHQRGLAEVTRIEGEMRKIMAEVGFSGTIPEFNETLRSDPQFTARTPDELMGVSSYVAKRVDGKLADYFGFLPRRRFEIRPVAAAHRAVLHRGPRRARFVPDEHPQPGDPPAVQHPRADAARVRARAQLPDGVPARSRGRDARRSAATSTSRAWARAGGSTPSSSARRWASTARPTNATAG